MTPAQMADLLQQFADQLGDLPAVHAAINAPSVELRDDHRKLMGDVKQAVGADVTRRLLVALEMAAQADPLVRAAVQQLVAGGLNFADDDVRATIDAMHTGGLLTAEDAAAVKAIGVWHVTPHQAAGGDGEASLAEVQAGATCLQLREWLAGASQDAQAKIAAGLLTSQAAVLAEMGA